jgi:hypothetical protein
MGDIAVFRGSERQRGIPERIKGVKPAGLDTLRFQLFKGDGIARRVLDVYGADAGSAQGGEMGAGSDGLTEVAGKRAHIGTL